MSQSTRYESNGIDGTPPVKQQDASRFGAALLGLALLTAVGSFGTWSGVRPRRVFSHVYFPQAVGRGIQNWEGQGWMTLTLAIVSAAFVITALAHRTNPPRVIAMTLMAAVVAVATYNVIDILHWYYSGPYLTFFVGWGLWLCLGSATFGVVSSSACGPMAVRAKTTLRHVHLFHVPAALHCCLYITRIETPKNDATAHDEHHAARFPSRPRSHPPDTATVERFLDPSLTDPCRNESSYMSVRLLPLCVKREQCKLGTNGSEVRTDSLCLCAKWK